jgi:hypothetical protein
MKKTQSITLTILAATALAGCGRGVREAEVKRCVDENNVMQDDRDCNQQRSGPGTRPYRYVYGGNGGYWPGSIVTNAKDSPTPSLPSVNASELAAKGVTSGGARVGVSSSGFTTAPSARGGFGATGEGHGGGGE